MALRASRFGSYTPVKPRRISVKRMTVVLVVVGSICALACGAGSEPELVQVTVPAPKEAGPVPTILDRPFTAEQIRDEWVEGFQLRIRQWTPEAEAIQVWTVVRADGDAVDIKSEVLDENGSVVDEATVQTSSWVQLRDHASFPVDRATREAVVRETPLGELKGWLYTVADPGGATVSEFFFAEKMPGAPVFVHVLRDGELVEIFEQVERSRPEQ